jgi:hypothetical protein
MAGIDLSSVTFWGSNTRHQEQQCTDRQNLVRRRIFVPKRDEVTGE